MHWLIVANGEKLPPTRLKQLASSRLVLACDGAIHDCLQHDITVDACLGDFDSISTLSLQQNNWQTIHAPDQDKTDSEKALLHLLKLGCEDIVLCQAMGDRTDHSLINLGLLSRYHSPQLQLILAREHENTVLARDESITISGKAGDHVAIMGYPEATVTSNGLTYECNRLKLAVTGASSGCNSLVNTKATIALSGSALICFTQTASTASLTVI